VGPAQTRVIGTIIGTPQHQQCDGDRASHIAPASLSGINQYRQGRCSLSLELCKIRQKKDRLLVLQLLWRRDGWGDDPNFH
jgi:hypothetical protein